jgi:hypothetical protein
MSTLPLAKEKAMTEYSAEEIRCIPAVNRMVPG